MKVCLFARAHLFSIHNQKFIIHIFGVRLRGQNIIMNYALCIMNYQKRDIGGTTLSRYTKLMLGRYPEFTEKEKCT